jgi:NAD(P)H-hydrate epimerase
MSLPSLKRQQVRAIDQAAIEQWNIPGVVLMENAGRNAADEVERILCGAPNRRVAILAGAGNNGGDGYVIARHLANRGARAIVFRLAPDEKISGDAATNLTIIRQMHLTIVPPDDLTGDELQQRLGEGQFDLIVDALGGTGISGALRGGLADAVEQVNTASTAHTIPVVAVDIPTGLDCDTGRAEGPAIRADWTVTFVARKAGFDNPASLEYTGKVEVVDIGIDAAAVARLAGVV